jgi:hypothetical protein
VLLPIDWLYATLMKQNDLKAKGRSTNSDWLVGHPGSPATTCVSLSKLLNLSILSFLQWI